MGETLAFSQARFENLIFLDIQLNGHPATAMFDTGAGMTVMPRKTAEAVGVEWDGEGRRGGSNTGSVLSLKTGTVQKLQIGSAALLDWTVGVLEDSAYAVGQDSQGRPFPADLLLGWDVISRFCWEFDMERRTVTRSAGGSMPKTAELCWDRYAIVRADFGGVELPLGFDCGHTETMLDGSWRERVCGLRSATTNTVGLGAALEETVSLIPELELRISGTALRLRDVEVLDRPIPGARPGSITGLLGADILAGRCWTIDAKSGCFRLI